MKTGARILLLLSLFLSAIASPAGTVSAQPATPATQWSIFMPLAGTICAGAELLDDTGFEAGLPNATWQTTSNVFSDILDDSAFIPAHSGTWKAWLGGDNLVQESVWQTFTVPSGLQGLRISYWWRIDTLEPSHPFDTLQVQLRNGAGVALQTLEALDDGDASGIWKESSFVISGYSGQTVQLAFVAQTDATRPTSFFVDDVSVVKTCPSGLAGDVTGDCSVRVQDIQETAARWNLNSSSACYAAPYDQDSSGVIDVTDIQLVADQWGQQGF